MTQRSWFHLNCLLLALFTPKAEQRVYGQRGRATVVALIHVTEGNTSHRHSGNISSATGSQQEVSKWRRGVCGMGDLGMEGVSTHCLLHCRLWWHQVERQSTCGDGSLQLFCFQFFNGQTSASLLKENEESGDFKRTTWGRAKTRTAKLYCK